MFSAPLVCTSESTISLFIETTFSFCVTIFHELYIMHNHIDTVCLFLLLPHYVLSLDALGGQRQNLSSDHSDFISVVLVLGNFSVFIEHLMVSKSLCLTFIVCILSERIWVNGNPTYQGVIIYSEKFVV